MSKGSEKMDAPPMRINFKRVLEEIETFKYNDKTTQQEAAAHTSLLKEVQTLNLRLCSFAFCELLQ